MFQNFISMKKKKEILSENNMSNYCCLQSYFDKQLLTQSKNKEFERPNSAFVNCEKDKENKIEKKKINKRPNSALNSLQKNKGNNAKINYKDKFRELSEENVFGNYFSGKTNEEEFHNYVNEEIKN